MLKRDLIIENDRLRAEVSFLRGQLAEVGKQPELVVGHVEQIVRNFLVNVTAPSPPNVVAEEMTVPFDWTDQMAPRTAPAPPPDPDFDRMEYELNEQLQIADELERDP
jgi:hypothetical protein